MCKTLFPTMTRTLSLFISVTYQKVNKFRIHNGLQAGYIRGLTICRQQRNIQSIKFRTCTTNRFLPLASSPLACTAKGFCTVSSKLSLRTHTTFPPGNSLNEDIDLIAVKLKNELKNVLVVAGAGLSTPSGIPDFRSPGSGIYDNIQKYKLPYPEAIFDIEYFRTHPQPFNTWSKEFLPGVNYQPSIGHYFIRLLQDKNKLLRHFTQNIDGLEVLAGVQEQNIVAAHGSFSTASCIYCKKPADFQKVKTAILNEETPHCQGKDRIFINSKKNCGVKVWSGVKLSETQSITCAISIF